MGLPLLTLWWRRFPKLARRTQAPEVLPKVTVVVTAKDEGDRISNCLSSLLASDYPDLQLIAVNDRSQDTTGQEIDRLAATDARTRAVHIDELPPEWLGKNHAMWQGARQARGDWILFTDGDVLYQPDTIRLAVSWALGQRLDHLAIIPSMLTGGYLETALVSFFGLIFAAATQPWLIRMPTRHFYAGVGAFNLVRRDFYEAAGGHHPLAYEIADDLRLGQLLKRHGARADLLVAGDLLQIRWQQSAWTTITGLEKNGFAALKFSIPRTCLLVTSAILFFFAPVLALALCSGPVTWGFAAALTVSHLCYSAGAHVLGTRPWVLPMLLPSALGILFAFLRSMIITLRQGGVRWRDTFYPLGELRRRMYR
ncbi:MAG: glycosyltransferase family 2 protein [Planctomycetales bacterium]|nr:glycosyltransferase family 2 protein [Planctomycetales bacterium]